MLTCAGDNNNSIGGGWFLKQIGMQCLQFVRGSGLADYRTCWQHVVNRPAAAVFASAASSIAVATATAATPYTPAVLLLLLLLLLLLP